MTTFPAVIFSTSILMALHKAYNTFTAKLTIAIRQGALSLLTDPKLATIHHKVYTKTTGLNIGAETDFKMCTVPTDPVQHMLLKGLLFLRVDKPPILACSL